MPRNTCMHRKGRSLTSKPVLRLSAVPCPCRVCFLSALCSRNFNRCSSISISFQVSSEARTKVEKRVWHISRVPSPTPVKNAVYVLYKCLVRKMKYYCWQCAFSKLNNLPCSYQTLHPEHQQPNLPAAATTFPSSFHLGRPVQRAYTGRN